MVLLFSPIFGENLKKNLDSILRRSAGRKVVELGPHLPLPTTSQNALKGRCLCGMLFIGIIPRPDHHGHELRATSDSEGPKDIVKVILDRLKGDPETFCNLFVASPLQHLHDDLRLSEGEVEMAKMAGEREGRAIRLENDDIPLEGQRGRAKNS